MDRPRAGTCARTVFLSVAAWLGAAACGGSGGSGSSDATATATATADCRALQALDQRCALGLDVDPNQCIPANAAEPAACRAATHAYVNCVVKLTCQVILDANVDVCVAENDNLNLSCPAEADSGAADANAAPTGTATTTDAGPSRRATPRNTAAALRRLGG